MEPDIRGIKWTFVLVGVADGTLMPFIPLYLLERGLGAAAIGAVLAAMAVVWLFAGLAWSYLADHRFGPERILLAGTAGAAALSLTLLLPADGTMLGLLIVALTLVRSPLTLLDAIALRKLRTMSRTGYARIRLRMSAGWVVSAVASGAVYLVFGLRIIPVIYAPLTAVVALWVWRAVKSESTVASGDAAPIGTGVHFGGIPLALVGFLLSGLLLGISLAATQNFVTLQISVLGGGALLVGAAAAFQALTEIPTMGYTHVLTRYVSHRAQFARLRHLPGGIRRLGLDLQRTGRRVVEARDRRGLRADVRRFGDHRQRPRAVATSRDRPGARQVGDVWAGADHRGVRRRRRLRGAWSTHDVLHLDSCRRGRRRDRDGRGARFEAERRTASRHRGGNLARDTLTPRTGDREG